MKPASLPSLTRCPARLVLSALLAVLVFSSARETLAFSLFSGCDATGFSNIVANPSDMYTFDISDFTYKFAPNFDAKWPNPRVKQQVREALNTWRQANYMPYGTTFSYNRANGYQAFGDIRSVALHEIGHVLGLTHPDQGAAVSRNYRPSGGGFSAQAAVGTEVMRSWINAGDYNHVLSQDELDAFRLMYGRPLTFTEVPSSSTADITLQAYTAGASNWANGGCSGVYRTGNTCQGVRSTTGGVSFNDSSTPKLGLKSKGINWDYRNLSGQPTSSLTIRTRGTNNTTPLFVYSNEGPRRFNSFNVFTTGIFFLPAVDKDDLFHVWSSPAGGPIPAGDILHVGLEQDVWDWSVVTAEVKSPGGVATTPALLSFHDWANTVIVATPAGAVSTAASASPFQDLTTRGEVFVKARGLRIVNSSSRALVSDLMIGRVDDLRLRLPDLNRNRLEALMANQRVQPVEGFGQRILEPKEDFYLVLDGDPASLPEEVLAKGNYLYMQRPDLLDHDLFAFAKSRNDDSEVGTYALLQNEPVASADTHTYCFYEGSIPDGSPNGGDFPVQVEGLTGAVTKVVVSATIFHPSSKELILVLERPDGKQVLLSSHNGSGEGYGRDCPSEQYGTHFDDDADLSIFQGDSPFMGEFRPEQPLSAFRGSSGRNLNGTWRLRVFDTEQGQQGYLACWCLTLFTCDGDCAETINSSPKIQSVAVSPAMAGLGDPVHVVVEAIDDTMVALVTANGHSLSEAGGNRWEGDVPSEAPFGPHAVHVVASDSSGNSADDASKSYSTARLLHANNRALTEQMIPAATANFAFGAAGRVIKAEGDELDISDGSGTPLHVVAPGHTLQVGDFCLTRGTLDVSGFPVTLYSTASRTVKAD